MLLSKGFLKGFAHVFGSVHLHTVRQTYTRNNLILQFTLQSE